MTETAGHRRDMGLDESDHHYIVLSHLHTWMRDRAAPRAHGTLLDYGCGGQPYRALFTPKLDRYISADIKAPPGITLDIVLTPDGPVPLPDASVDTVLSSQTLEHVPSPPAYLTECFRLLKSGGTLILTAPMQWRHHEVPYDYTRFTRFGIEKLVRDAGFSLDSMTPTGGVFALLGQILLNHLSERGRRWPVTFKWINRVALWLDRRYPDGEDTINWMCIARKP